MRRHSTVAQRLSCASTLYPKLLLSPSSWPFPEQVREAVQEPSEGAQFVWGAVKGEILGTEHSSSSVYTANARSAPSPLRPCLPAYPEKTQHTLKRASRRRTGTLCSQTQQNTVFWNRQVLVFLEKVQVKNWANIHCRSTSKSWLGEEPLWAISI